MPKTVILIARVAIDAEISIAMRFPDLCNGGAPFTRAIGPSRVVRLADDEILDDIGPEWRLAWKTGSTIRVQYQRAAKAIGLLGEASKIITMHCPRHRMFEYQLLEGGKLKPGPRRRALICDDVPDPLEALQALYGCRLTVTKVRRRV